MSCIRGGNCPGPHVSSPQLPGDVSFFANQLAVPTIEFAFEQTKAEKVESKQKTSSLSTSRSSCSLVLFFCQNIADFYTQSFNLKRLRLTQLSTVRPPNVKRISHHKEIDLVYAHKHLHIVIYEQVNLSSHT